ncbi:MAG: CopG family transcriptional regulator [Thiofilum sp.]|uniref:ribbon-helix-helix domain-containing protein n=1 Tax=Thiofilum sp. TaxID=2212733 RepID=UPI0025F9EE54|nr:CopG family transcriptional regulator [Thiofilum sp.]MBK8454121.1 ribbon-helix-helix protein, CopG family [Thiofilum sp.]
MRTIIDLPPHHVAQLDRFSQHEKVSRAELVRRAIAEYLARHTPAHSESEAFGLWAKRQEDGLDYQNRLREEWD